MNPFALRLAAAALALGTTFTAQATGAMQLSTANPSVAAGASFEVSVSGVGFVDALLGGGFMLSWNPAVLALNSVILDAVVWEFARGGGTTDNVAGTLSDAYFASNKVVLPTGNFAVGRLAFTALGGGATTITMAESTLFPFVSEAGEVVAVDLGHLNVGVVPEPATWLSMGLGLAGIAGIARRRRAAQA